jgi:two-component system sensor histidine kinase UhpB
MVMAPASALDRLRAAPLVWRVFAVNAFVFVAATVVLVASPATVSFPIALVELVVVVVGGGLMLGLNLVILQRVLAPLERLTATMRKVDPLRPGERISAPGSESEVADLTTAFNDMLDRLEHERADSARRALSAQENERLRIARELHDEVGQSLTAVVLGLDQTAREVGPYARERIAESREIVRDSLGNVRRIARELRPEALDDLGLLSALTSLATGLQNRTGVAVERRLDRNLPALPPDVELVIYRVAQEALTNIARHAHADRVRLVLAREADAMVLTVTDDGDGVAQIAGPAAGIRGMRERAVLVGGRLSIASTSGGGTEVRLEVPCR